MRQQRTLSEIKKAIQGLSSSEREKLFSTFEVSNATNIIIHQIQKAFLYL